ncbi:MAG: C-GCAxxG-C-C family protein [Candidatus Atribacteria bacterium]|nr:C-GCAxxG-C-C family protein [Candidatus Atribacteria bacterium]
MLKELIQEGYGVKEDLNCAETILYAANQIYHLDLNSDSLKLAAAFDGGMGIESVCGALAGSLMVLGRLFIKETAHQHPEIKELSKELFDTFQKEMGDILCKPLKDKYRTEEKKCREVILKGAEVLDKIITRELNKRKNNN